MRQDYHPLCYKSSIEGKAGLPFPKMITNIRKCLLEGTCHRHVVLAPFPDKIFVNTLDKKAEPWGFCFAEFMGFFTLGLMGAIVKEDIPLV